MEQKKRFGLDVTGAPGNIWFWMEDFRQTGAKPTETWSGAAAIQDL
jgi:hypothetical protein